LNECMCSKYISDFLHEAMARRENYKIIFVL
jgi:hypothetical protein